jgi:ADP-heptose:LPS heptosyltransferase
LGTKSARKLRLVLAAFLFRLLKTRKVTANPFEVCGSEARILVIRQQNQMGDMLLATPCLRALRQTLPQGWITLLASHENEAVVHNNPYVDEVLIYDKKAFRRHPFSFIRFLGSLRKRGFDISVVLSTVSFSVTSSLLSLVSRARYRLGYSGKSYGLGFVDRAFHVTVPLVDEGKHQTKVGLGLLEYFGVTTDNLSPIMVPSEEDKRFAEEFALRFSLLPGSEVVGIHPGAGKMKNRWPASKFARVANELGKNHGARIVVIGGPSDAEVLGATLKDLEFAPIVLTGESIGRVAAVMRRLSLFICNDTGVLHVAAAVGCPTLALFGPTDPLRWAPIADCVRALRAPSFRIDELKEEVVLALAVQMISWKGNVCAGPTDGTS